MIALLVYVLLDTRLIDPSLFDTADRNQQLYILRKKGIVTALPDSYTLLGNPCISFHQRDQGSCGSCWATSTAMAIGERRCLKSGEQKWISIEEYTSCDHTSMYGVKDSGCNGGHPLVAMQYSYTVGTVFESCNSYKTQYNYYPYPYRPCSVNCDNNTPKVRVKNTPARRLSSEQAIMDDIFTNGPVTGAFYLYSGFASGVANDAILQMQPNTYQQGGHAIVIIGWGVRNGVKYWQMQNTWGADWGNNGYFKMRRGQNDFGIESQAAACDPIFDTPIVVPGSFTFQNTWITGNTVQIDYKNMASCNLTIGSTVIAQISGNGSTNYPLTLAAGTYQVSCGTVKQTVAVITYVPKFNSTLFSGQANTPVRVYFSTNGLNQTITFNGTSQTASLGYADIIFKVAGTYAVTVQTIGTNPILSASIQVQIYPPDDRILNITLQPLPVYTNTTANVTVQVQNIAAVYVFVYNQQNALVSTIQNPWTNPQNNSLKVSQVFSYTPSVAGTYYFSLVSGNLTLNSSTFAVTDLVLKILVPVSGQVVLQGQTLLVKTIGAKNGDILYVNQMAAGQVQNDVLSWVVNVSPGSYQLLIGTASTSIVVIPTPHLDKKQYNISTQDIVTVGSTPAFVFDSFVTIQINGAQVKLVNNQAKPTSPGVLTMLVNGAIPPYQETAAVVQYVPIPSSPFASYSPANDSLFNAGQTMNILWGTTLAENNEVTISLFSGVMGKQIFISVLTSTAKNNGKFSFVLPASLTPGKYFVIVRTFDGGTTLYYFIINFNIQGGIIDNREMNIITHPLPVYTNTTANVTVQVQNIAAVYVFVYNQQNVLVSTILNPWTNPQNNSLKVSQVFSYTPSVAGTYYFSLVSGNLTLNSSTFAVTDLVLKILVPVSGQVVLQGQTLLVKTIGAKNGDILYVNQMAAGQVQNDVLSWVVNVSPGSYQLLIGTASTSIVVIPTPHLDKKQYNISTQDIVTVGSTPAFVFDSFVTIQINGAQVKLVNNQAKPTSPGVLTMLVNGAIPPYQETAAVVQYVPIPSSPFASYSPANDSLFNAGQTMNILWGTTLAENNEVTISLFSGVMGKQIFISVLTSTAKNNGKFSFVLPASLTPGKYFVIVRTFDGGTTLYYFIINFNIQLPLQIKTHKMLGFLHVDVNDEADMYLMSEKGELINLLGKGREFSEFFRHKGKFYVRACRGEECVDSTIFG
ncbi:Cathepsin_B [Hexamita inflata]|uniref:Cathepsin B n=1 Tax=Hexamita inflata TaxID=28002 RepID=A0AA86RFN9_9EUKA|nr:Cathepsin B [Hexamita inflata]